MEFDSIIRRFESYMPSYAINVEYVIIVLHSVSAVFQILVRSGQRICMYVCEKVYCGDAPTSMMQ